MVTEAGISQTTWTDEAGLIDMIIGGRRDLFGDLIAPHLTPLSRIVQATVGVPHEVEDIVQQAALKAFIHLRQFRFEASFRTWLIRIGLNEARQWRRKYAGIRLLECANPAMAELCAANDRHSPWSECQRNESVARLRAAIARLPEKYRIVILLRDLEERSIDEVAGRLGLSVPAVKSRHLRARRKMAGLLGSVHSPQGRGSENSRVNSTGRRPGGNSSLAA